MISIDEFRSLVHSVLNYDLDSNKAQREGVNHEGSEILMLVAGPGSGKTAILVLRALRHVLVDGVPPENILITTFTRKAARELRTRWLDWGTLLLNSFRANDNLREAVDRIDLNRCRIDTLDSIAQQALTENRLPGEIAPILIEGSASKLILKRSAFSEIYDANKGILDRYLGRYTFDGSAPQNKGVALSVTKTICERLLQDQVNPGRFGIQQANQIMLDILSRYRDHLKHNNVFDFAVLECVFLERLQSRSLREWTQEIKALLIDEYQDTNPLQEAIYFEIIRAVSPSATIVGDDDQAMYRFRGGSVELFTQFAARCFSATGKYTRRIDMITNYRSSEEIVSFYNGFIGNDPRYLPSRISPAKPSVVSNRGMVSMPVLGLFRSTTADLAESLADWLRMLFENKRAVISSNSQDYELSLLEEGAMGDCVLLAHSIEEVTFDRYSDVEKTRFTGYFRGAMLRQGFQVFNPRGRALRIIPDVQRLLGLLLLCVDPDNMRTNNVHPTREARYFLEQWRRSATLLISQNPAPIKDGGLAGFINKWQAVSRGTNDLGFPSDWPALELVFKLIAWIHEFQVNPEHQVWLEAITRTMANAGMASPYGMQLYQEGIHCERSRESLIRDALLPIAENEVDVDEDIMPSVPRSWFQLMTIHQAKGLEFPLVIVDVGSHFSINHHMQAFLRFPHDPSNVVLMEDDVEPYLGSPLRSNRTLMDRSFDDLVRLYYVAYSRPRSVLMLIGLESCLSYGRGKHLTGCIPNTALGWRRDGTWPWRQPFSGKKPPVRINPPFILL
jgi:DNA helicase-2/ATP-dependent DNA helicase PcrA